MNDKKITIQQKTFIQQAILADEVAHTGYVPLRDESQHLISPRDYKGTKQPKILYQALFGLHSAKIKVPAEMFHANMRQWLDACLLKIPFCNIFRDNVGSQEAETYTEICTLEPKEMEWGVIQKIVSLLLGISPDNYPIDADIRKEKLCYHNEHGLEQLQYKTCPICHGEGFGFGTNKPTEDKLKLLSYDKIVKNIIAIQLNINEQIQKTENDIVESIWFDMLNERDRMTIDNSITKIMKQQDAPQPQKINVAGAFGNKK